MLLVAGIAQAQKNSKDTQEKGLRAQLTEWLTAYSRYGINNAPCTLKEIHVSPDSQYVNITCGGGFQEQYFTPEVVSRIYDDVRSMLPDSLSRYDLYVTTDGRHIEDLVPNIMRKGGKDYSRLLPRDFATNTAPWVTNISRPYRATEGLEGSHIAVWQSHGRYYRHAKSEWAWQRPQLYCTCEDLFSQTFLVPYLYPMLEKAGAIVFTPRERDWQRNEVIVDNDYPDRGGTYTESINSHTSNFQWRNSPNPGFAKHKSIYYANDSLFYDGTARYLTTVDKPDYRSQCTWTPDIPEDGNYAVYVTYHSFTNSTQKAHYTVHHSGGMTEFNVNQRIGGGIWVYLGTFPFRKGCSDQACVVLDNGSSETGTIITADAVRFGGGMGNVLPESANAVLTYTDSTMTEPHVPDMISVSGMPRWAEAAKYSATWMGFPHRTHSNKFGIRDEYDNDINSRSQAVNYLSGGSVFNPAQEGLGVPIELTMACHTDAGYKKHEYTGPLAIYMTDFNEGQTGAGLDRYVSRDLASMLLANLSEDLKGWGWPVRNLWNRNYGEAREPLSAACILEMLSHQNFNDMQLGYDPKFKFAMTRSIYKTIVKFIATQHSRSYTIQPLPVRNFAVTLNENRNEAELSWEPTDDPSEPTATPTHYILYTKRGDGGFDNGKTVKGTSTNVSIEPGTAYSFRIAAANKGGESFQSETLSAYIAEDNIGTVLIVNAFTRLEGPAAIDTETARGFDLDLDPGVQYGAFAGFCGRQVNFNPSREGSDTGCGKSSDELAGTIVMGNTFDYPALHGDAIRQAGRHSYCSVSKEALTKGKININDYKMVDVICGVQKEYGRNILSILSDYLKYNGRMLLSAANIAPVVSGMDNLSVRADSTLTDKSINTVSGCGTECSFYREMNPWSYSVPAPTVLSAIADDNHTYPIMTYRDGQPSAVAHEDNDNRHIILGFPIESITSADKRNSLMRAFIRFLEK